MQKVLLQKVIPPLLLLAGVLSLALWYWQGSQTMPALFPAGRSTTLLLIDPGHGGEDGGAVSVSGEKESDINLSIALKCNQIAGLMGIPAELLRTEDSSLASPEAESLREKKREDLARRVEMVNSAQQAVLLSIHQNSFPDSSYSGAQVFYRPTEESEAWAIHTQELLRQVVNPDNRRQAKEIPSDIYLMSHISCPAILVECGFLSHAGEAQLLLEEPYQCRLSVAIIGAYLSLPLPAGEAEQRYSSAQNTN